LSKKLFSSNNPIKVIQEMKKYFWKRKKGTTNTNILYSLYISFCYDQQGNFLDNIPIFYISYYII
jgi:hypothetical protein